MKHAIPDEILTTHTAVLGMTGSGKTSTEKLIVEQVVAEGHRVCVLDTIKSDWWGITSSASGKSAGLPFKILGGPRGHVPLHSSAGKVIGQLVGSGKLPLSIIDMADFEAGGIQKFFVDFAQSLWRHTRGVVYLVIEEAHEIAPKERVGFGGENMSIHWAKKLGTGSRTKGIRLIVATQRVQSLHNAVLGSCQTLIAHQLMFEADQDPVVKWLKGVNKAAASEVATTLASLPTGTGWLCSGRAQIFQKVHFPKFKTFDNTATPTGKEGDIDVKTAPVDQDELKALIGEEVAKAEADDPKKLRERIRVLEGDNQKLERERDTARAQQAPAGPTSEDLAAAEQRGYASGFSSANDQWRAWQIAQASLVERSAALAKPLADLAADLATAARGLATPPLLTDLPQSGSPPAPRLAGAPLPPRPAAPAAARRNPSPAASGDGDRDLTNPQRTLLRSLAWWLAMGHAQVSRAQLAVVCGWSPNSSNVRDRLSEVAKLGLVEYPGTGMVRMTDAGKAAAPSPDTSATLIDSIRGILTNPQRLLFDTLIELHGTGDAPIERSGLASNCGWSPDSSNIRDRLSELSRLELVQYPRSGMVELQPWVLG